MPGAFCAKAGAASAAHVKATDVTPNNAYENLLVMLSSLMCFFNF
jgi:hypothetical protein